MVEIRLLFAAQLSIVFLRLIAALIQAAPGFYFQQNKTKYTPFQHIFCIAQHKQWYLLQKFECTFIFSKQYKRLILSTCCIASWVFA